MKNIKKATNQIGIGIIAMAILLLLGGIFLDDGTVYKDDYLDNKDKNNLYPEENYLFYLNSTDIGRQNKVTVSFPNVVIGAKEENNIIYVGNDFKLRANPFSKTYYSFNAQFSEPSNVNKFYLYFDVNRITGKQDIVVKIDDQIYYKNKATASEIPLTINYKPKINRSDVKVTIEIDKPAWYSLFNWNSFEFSELKVVENIQDKSNTEKDFSFQVDKQFLERVEINLVVDCQNTLDNIKPIQVDVNGYSIEDFTPNCASRYNTITREIPINILDEKQNNLQIKTKGYYKLAYSLNKIYFNDKETYKFTIANFNDVIDVVMYGDFDKDVVDLKLNGKIMSLKRNEIKSIIQYLRYGTNEVEFLTKPISIEEFVIEKSEFRY